MSRLLNILLVLTCLGAQAETPASAEFETRTVEGWTVQISKDLLAKHSADTAQGIEILTKHLQGIKAVVPAPAVASLQKVTLWMTPPPSSGRPTAEYHPDATWLKQHDRNPAMAKGVQISNVGSLAHEVIRMPVLFLHELSHAYHDQVLGFDQPEIKAAYEKAKASGKYDRVERWFGNGKPNTFEKAYAMTNEKEYFAECSEAFFGRNDFFPFTLAELKKHDPAIVPILEKVWGTKTK